MHPIRRAHGHLFGVPRALEDLRQVPGARPSEAAFLREQPEVGPSRPRLNPLRAAVGAVLRDARCRIGMSQPDLARALEVSPPMIQLWESGREPIPAPRVEMLARAVGLRPTDLSAPDHLVQDSEERRLLAWFRGLSPDLRRGLVERLPTGEGAP